MSNQRVSSGAARFAAIAGSSSAVPASNQSAFCRSLLPKVSMADFVGGDTDVVPSLFSACCVAVSQGLFSEAGGALTQVSDCCPGCGEAWASFLRGAVDSFGLKTHLAAN